METVTAARACQTRPLRANRSADPPPRPRKVRHRFTRRSPTARDLCASAPFDYRPPAPPAMRVGARDPCLFSFRAGGASSRRPQARASSKPRTRAKPARRIAPAEARRRAARRRPLEAASSPELRWAGFGGPKKLAPRLTSRFRRVASASIRPQRALSSSLRPRRPSSARKAGVPAGGRSRPQGDSKNGGGSVPVRPLRAGAPRTWQIRLRTRSKRGASGRVSRSGRPRPIRPALDSGRNPSGGALPAGRTSSAFARVLPRSRAPFPAESAGTPSLASTLLPPSREAVSRAPVPNVPLRAAFQGEVRRVPLFPAWTAISSAPGPSPPAPRAASPLQSRRPVNIPRRPRQAISVDTREKPALTAVPSVERKPGNPVLDGPRSRTSLSRKKPPSSLASTESLRETFQGKKKKRKDAIPSSWPI